MRDTDREAETQAEREKSSLWGTRFGTQSQDLWIMAWAEGRQTLKHWTTHVSSQLEDSSPCCQYGTLVPGYGSSETNLFQKLLYRYVLTCLKATQSTDTLGAYFYVA